VLKLSATIVRDCHRLVSTGASVREIAAKLGVGKSSVHRALKLPVPQEVPTGPKAREPIAVNRIQNQPQSLPPDAHPIAHCLANVLVRQQLWGEYDALTTFFGIDVPPIRPVVNALDMDAFLHRLSMATAESPLEACLYDDGLERLKAAFIAYE